MVHFLSTGRTPISLPLTPDIRVLGFTVLVSIATGFLFGIIPALRSSRVDLTPALKEGGYAASPHQRFGRTLIAAQVALSLVLVTGAGLFAGSFWKLNGIDPGFNRDQVLTVRLEPRGSDQKSANAVRLQHLYLKLQEEVQAIPGVVAVGFAGVSPATPLQPRTVRTPDGRQFRISWTQVYPKFFNTLGAPLLEGRDFGASDLAPGAPYVAIINETFARTGFPGENPIGKKIVCNRDQVCDVIGVVKDIKYSESEGRRGRRDVHDLSSSSHGAGADGFAYSRRRRFSVRDLTGPAIRLKHRSESAGV